MAAIAKQVIDIPIEQEMTTSYVRYAMSVIVGRAFPDVRDGLKPVHRRILYAMYDEGNRPDQRRVKCGAVVGEVLKKYHPHGDQAVYDTLVRMVQDFSLRYPLIDGQGNFGCFTGDTKIRLLDGTERTFAELAELPPDEIFYVYSVDASGRIVVGEGRHSRVTRGNAQLVELTFDDGSTVRCTPDHRFMLRDGTWKEARGLTIEDSLMAGYFDTAPVNPRTSDYLRVFQPKTGEWEFAHHVADEYNEQRGLAPSMNGAFVRHHKNGNRFDNRPPNIERMLWLEHLHLHAEQIRSLWETDDFRQAQREGVQRYYANNPEAVEARRQRMVAQNKNPKFRKENGARVARKLRERHAQHPELAAQRGEYLRQLWQDPDYRAKMSRALRGIEKRPLTPAQKKRVAGIISEKSRGMWSDAAKRAEITNAIIRAMSDPELRAQLSENSQRLWQDPNYRAKYAPDHHRCMALQLWSHPGTHEQHREKMLRQWQDPAFRAAHLEGRKHDYERRIAQNPNAMAELAKRAAVSLRQKWSEENYAQRVMRTKIAGYVSRLMAEFGREKITPELYETQRDERWIPNIQKALNYFESFDELLSVAATHNHRIVSVRWLDECGDVYDITVDEHHNFMLANGCVVHNSVDGDPPAAYRYTEARLAPIAMELLRDIDQETVDFIPNYDESTTEPSVLPSVFPHLLVNGSQGIGVGMATNIPPHNLGEVCDAVSYLIDHLDTTIDQLMKIVPGPDFPTAGMILGMQGIREAYETGRGIITMQARAVIEPLERGQNAILITELPYQQNKATLIEQIARLVREKKMPEGISEIRDESDRTGLRIVIELKRDTNPHVILNHLYKHTSLRQTFGIINLAIVNGEPRVLSLKETLEYFIQHRQDVITRRTQFQLKKAQARAHILEGFRLILRHLDEVVALIRAARNREEARQGLRDRYNLSEDQANAVLNMQLGQLTQLDQRRIQDEYTELLKEIEMLEGILADPRRVLHIIKEDMRRIKREYGDERRTQIRIEEAKDIKIEDLIAEEDMVITVTRDGYIKRLPVDTYRTQGRGGKGMIGLTKKEEDVVQHLFIANTHSQILFFTDQGRVYQLRAFEVPAASRQARGTPIINLVQVEPGEKITATIPVRDFKQKGYLFMCTKLGTVKKTALEEFDTRYSKGLIAITLDDKDELRWVEWTDGKREIVLGTRQGMSIRFSEDDVRSMGRPAAGVIGMRMKRGDYIIGMDVVKKGHDLLVVSEQGYGKRTDVNEYRIQSRGGSGILTLKVTEKNGPLVDLRVVHPDDELLIITQRGVIIRQKVGNISQVGRNTQGVRLIRLDDGDKVSAVARIVREQEE